MEERVLAVHDKRIHLDLDKLWLRDDYAKVTSDRDWWITEYEKERKEKEEIEEKLREEKIRRAYFKSFSPLVKYGEKKAEINFFIPLRKYNIGKEIEIKMPLAGVDTIYSSLPPAMLHDIEHTQFPQEQEAKANILQELSPQYVLVDRCTKFVFAPITALAFVLSVIFYLSANIGMAVGLVGIGITSLLLTTVFSVTKSSLKE